jgi:hypothetical protein
LRGIPPPVIARSDSDEAISVPYSVIARNGVTKQSQRWEGQGLPRCARNDREELRKGERIKGKGLIKSAKRRLLIVT